MKRRIAKLGFCLGLVSFGGFGAGVAGEPERAPSMVAPDLSTQLENSTCRVLMRRRSNGYVYGLCSGSLTATREIRTARHCFDSHDPSLLRIEVQCGFLEVNASVPPREAFGEKKFADTGVIFQQTFEASALWINDPASATRREVGDQARIRLSKDAPAAWVVPVATSADMAAFFPAVRSGGMQGQDARVGSGVDCKMEGFGRNAEGVFGLPGSAKAVPAVAFDGLIEGRTWRAIQDPKEVDRCRVEQSKVDWNQNAHEMNWIESLVDRRLILRTPLRGDSGGPLLCRKAKGQWKLVGIEASLRPRLEQQKDGVWGIHHSYKFGLLAGPVWPMRWLSVHLSAN